MGVLDKLFKPNVDKLKTKKDVKGLIKALNRSDSTVRTNALKALVELNSVEGLIAALNSPHENIGKIAAQSLGKIDGDIGQAFEPYLAYLRQTPQYSGETNTLIKLASLHGENGRDILCNIVSDNRYSIQQKGFASYALGLLGDKRAVEPMKQILSPSPSVTDVLIKLDKERAVEYLTRSMNVGHPESALLLANFRTPQAVSALTSKLNDISEKTNDKQAEKMCDAIVTALKSIGSVAALRVVQEYEEKLAIKKANRDLTCIMCQKVYSSKDQLIEVHETYDYGMRVYRPEFDERGFLYCSECSVKLAEQVSSHRRKSTSYTSSNRGYREHWIIEEEVVM